VYVFLAALWAAHAHLQLPCSIPGCWESAMGVSMLALYLVCTTVGCTDRSISCVQQYWWCRSYKMARQVVGTNLLCTQQQIDLSHCTPGSGNCDVTRVHLNWLTALLHNDPNSIVTSRVNS